MKLLKKLNSDSGKIGIGFYWLFFAACIAFGLAVALHK